MRILKKTAAVLAAGIFCLASMPFCTVRETNTAIIADAIDYTEVTIGELAYRVYSDHAEIYLCSRSAEGEILIPAKVNGMPVSVIGAGAFSLCNHITSVAVPNNVKTIEQNAFSNCTSLESVTLPSYMTTIETSAFSGCTSLNSITLPSSLTYLGTSAFENCSSLVSIIFPSSLEYVGSRAFYGCESLFMAKLNNKIKRIESYTFSKCSSLSTLKIPKGITEIGAGAFSGCSALTELIIPESVTTIEEYAFRNCSGIKNVEIPVGVEFIGQLAFLNCQELQKLTIMNPKCYIYNHKLTIGNDNSGNYSGVISGYDGSSAETYAKKYEINFVSLGQSPFTTTAPTTTTTTSPPTTTTANETSPTIPETSETEATVITTAKTTTTTATTKTTTSTTVTTKATLPASTVPIADCHPFRYGIDNWGFKNVGSNFKDYGNKYTITDDDYNKLIYNLSNTDKYIIQDFFNTKQWGGSCYGMAVTSILNCYGIIEPSELQDNAVFLSDVKPTEEIISLINYYQVMQKTDFMAQKINQMASISSSNVKIDYLIECVKSGLPTLVTYRYEVANEIYRHAVVAYGMEKGIYTFGTNKAYDTMIKIYDNNKETDDPNYNIYYHSGTKDWYIPINDVRSNEGRDDLEFITNDLSLLNYNGYSQTVDEKYMAVMNIANNENLSIYTFDLNGGSDINSGNWADYDLWAEFFDDETPNSNLQTARRLGLKDGNTGYLASIPGSETKSLDVSLRYQNCILGIKADSASSLKFHPSGYLEFNGKNSGYEFNLLFNDGHYPTYWYSLIVNGSAASNAKISTAENGFILSADDLSRVAITASNDSGQARLSFSTDYNKVLIYGIDEKTIGIAVDKDGDGEYETTIAETSKHIYGDSNCDGVLSAADATLILQYCGNKDKYKISEQGLLNADVDGTLGISPLDALVIQQTDAGVYQPYELPLRK